MRSGRTGLLAAGAAALALAGAGCAGPATPVPRIDFAGTSAVHVVYAEGDGERIEMRGPSYRRIDTVPLPGGGARRDENQRRLDRDEVARVIAWAGDHDALTLRSPDGARALPTVAAPPPITLEVRIGEAEIGIGWAEGEAWPDAAMGARVAAAVTELRALAAGFDRASDIGSAP